MGGASLSAQVSADGLAFSSEERQKELLRYQHAK
jgi:hypothetical protein